jgi:hypothetical protein
VGFEPGDGPMTVWVKSWVGLLGATRSNLLKRMAGTTGLEPAASAVTGQRSNQLNYVPGLCTECQMVGSAGLEPATSCL